MTEARHRDDGPPERWWIVDAAAHRATERTAVVEVPDWLKGAAVINMMPIDDDDWCCDYCNATIELVNEDGVGQFVPVHHRNAICVGCYRRLMTEYGQRAALGGWSDVLCACQGCSARMAVLDAEGVVAFLAAQLGAR
jgi:hypothetical protein